VVVCQMKEVGAAEHCESASWSAFTPEPLLLCVSDCATVLVPRSDDSSIPIHQLPYQPSRGISRHQSQACVTKIEKYPG